MFQFVSCSCSSLVKPRLVNKVLLIKTALGWTQWTFVTISTYFIQFIFNACIPIHFLVAGLQEATIAVTEKSVKKVMTLDDETFDKFYRHTEEIAKISSRVEINDDFDAIFGVELPR